MNNKGWEEEFERTFVQTTAMSFVVPAGAVYHPDSERLKAFITRTREEAFQQGKDAAVEYVNYHVKLAPVPVNWGNDWNFVAWNELASCLEQARLTPDSKPVTEV